MKRVRMRVRMIGVGLMIRFCLKIGKIFIYKVELGWIC